MGLRLKQDKRGKWRWYGEYMKDGDRFSVSSRLLPSVKGTPPASGRLTDTGDSAFEESRLKAAAALDAIIQSTDREAAPADLARKIYTASTGIKWRNRPIDFLLEAYKARDYDGQRPTEAYLKRNETIIQDFIDWIRAEDPGAKILDITSDTAKRYRDHLRQEDANGHKLTARSLRAIRGALSLAFTSPHVLPTGALNPFGKGSLEIRSHEGDETVHREPVLNEKMQALMDACDRSDDREVADMIVAGAVTGLRRGDVALLKWESVNLDEPLPGVTWKGGMHVRTSKTGAPVDLPIVPRLRNILLSRKQGKAGKTAYVFPEAATLVAGPAHDGEGADPDALTDRIKLIFVAALAPEAFAKIESYKKLRGQALSALDDSTLARARASIINAPEWTHARKAKTLDFLERYMAGKGLKIIQKETGASTGLISLYLHAVEELIQVRFVRAGSKKDDGIKKIISDATCRNLDGRRAVSVYDFHALRTSFVTALKLGGMMDEEIVKFTGHQYRHKESRVGSIVLEVNYNKIKATDYAARLEAILPRFLTGCTGPDKTKQTFVGAITADDILANLPEGEMKKLRLKILKEMKLI